jgi:hypothetical protein
MMTDKGSSDEADDQGLKLYREDLSALFEVLVDLMEERDLDEEHLVPLLIEATYYYRSLAYAFATAKPSENGLRMDLDRMRKLTDEMHRDYRKNAGDVLKDMIAMLDTIAVAGDTAADVDHEEAGPPQVISDGSGR